MSISVAPLGSFNSKLSLNAAELPKIDAEFEEITEGEELTKKEKLKTKWAALEALVSARSSGRGSGDGAAQEVLLCADWV